MKRACFDADGFCLWVAHPSFACEAPAGATVIDVGDEAEAQAIFRDARGIVVARTTGAIAADRTLVEVGSPVRITVPNPAWVLVNGVRQRVTGGALTIMPTIAGITQVELIGQHQSEPVVITAQTAAQAEADLLAAVDAAAGEARKAWLTMGPGQADAYREKMVDVASLNTLGGTTALILVALGAIPAAQQKARWPFLYAEMQAGGLASLVAARDAIVGAADASRQARAEIERRRRAGQRAIRSATSVLAKRVAYDAVRWS